VHGTGTEKKNADNPPRGRELYQEEEERPTKVYCKALNNGGVKKRKPSPFGGTWARRQRRSFSEKRRVLQNIFLRNTTRRSVGEHGAHRSVGKATSARKVMTLARRQGNEKLKNKKKKKGEGVTVKENEDFRLGG